MSEERLQKVLAAAGIASRRHAEEMITSGRVSVNGTIVTELGTKADPERDHIKVDGRPLPPPERKLYFLLNKPKGYVTTVSDPEGRPTVMDLVRGIGVRLYPVGRLDYLSEGLVLMTNDGEVARRLTHAASHVPKTYMVKVSGRPSEEAIRRLRGGVVLRPTKGKSDQRPVRTAPAEIRLLRDASNPWYEMTLIEGKNRQIRRMFEEVGHHVEKIKRVGFGSLQLDVEPGRYRPLKPAEVMELTRVRNIRPEPRAQRPKQVRRDSEYPARQGERQKQRDKR